MSRPRVCPHCFQLIPTTTGFHFDEELNMIHDLCGKIVVSATASADNQPVKHRYATTTTPIYTNPHSSSTPKPYSSGWEG